MTISIDWSLLQPVDIGGSFQQGLENGQKMARQRAVENALRDYTDGGMDGQPDPAMSERKRRAEGVLAAYAPQQLNTLTQLEARRAATADALASRQRLQGAVELYGTDPTAARRAVALDPAAAEVIDKMDERQRQNVLAGARLLSEINPTDDASYQRAMQLAHDAGIDLTNAPPTFNQEWVDGIKHIGAALTTTKPTEQPSSVREYEYAKAQGYAGTFEQWQQSNGGPVVVDNGDGTKTIYQRSQLTGGGSPAPAVGALGPGTTGDGTPSIVANNNPGALRKPGSMEFQRFGSREEGVQAQQRQLGRYLRRGVNTVASVVEKWAPRARVGGDNSDASVDNYISYVSDRLGIQPGQTLSTSDIPRLAAAMAEFETGDRKPAKSQMASNDAPKIASKADFDKLPSGTRFTAPDGSVRVKP